MDSRLLAVATQLLDEEGWAALSLDRIPESAGIPRATVWRAGLTRGAVERVLRTRLAADYKDLMWRRLTMAGSGLDRLDAALPGGRALPSATGVGWVVGAQRLRPTITIRNESAVGFSGLATSPITAGGNS